MKNHMHFTSKIVSWRRLQGHIPLSLTTGITTPR